MNELKKVALLIDNAYLSMLTKEEFDGARLDYLKLSDVICEGFNRIGTYVYDAHSYLPPLHIPLSQDFMKRLDVRGKQSSFLNALQYLPKFTVRIGETRRRGDHYIQKKVDVLLSIDLVVLSLRHEIEQAFLIAGDEDFLPAARMAKNEGVQVTLIHSGRMDRVSDNGKSFEVPKYSKDLWNECNQHIAIDSALIEKCLRQT